MLRFGQPVRDLIDAPGLYVKWPFVDSVIYIDKRILDLDESRQEVLVADNQRLEVDAFVRYRIADPLRFYQSVGRSRGQRPARRHAQFRPAADLVGGLDHRHRARQARRADGGHPRPGEIAGAKRFGLAVVDVRIKRADLPPKIPRRCSTACRPSASSARRNIRAQGSQQSQQIKAEADRKVTVTIARRSRRPSRSRGQGDAERNRIFAESYGKDPDFFAFYRSMQAYEKTLQ